jgi:hypothetical protein
MTDDIYARKLDELDRLLNDPAVPIDPDLIWSLLDEIIASTRQVLPNLSSGRLSEKHRAWCASAAGC